DEFQYQWEKDGDFVDGATTESFYIDETTGEHEYACQVTAINGFGSTQKWTIYVNQIIPPMMIYVTAQFIPEVGVEITLVPEDGRTLSELTSGVDGPYDAWFGVWSASYFGMPSFCRSY